MFVVVQTHVVQKEEYDFGFGLLIGKVRLGFIRCLVRVVGVASKKTYDWWYSWVNKDFICGETEASITLMIRGISQKIHGVEHGAS